MTKLHISDVRPFIPAQDFAVSKAFYEALGWKVGWSDEKLALLESDGHSFYLQAYYQKDWAENTMLHITVQDAQACYAQIKPLTDSGRYPGARVTEPRPEPYGALVTYVWDPSGVLLHLAQWTPPDPSARIQPRVS